MKNRSKDLKRKKLFNPDIIADKLDIGINRDLSQPSTYGCNQAARDFVAKSQKASTLKKYLRADADSNLDIPTYIKFLYVNDHMGSYCSTVQPQYGRISHLGDWSIFSNVLHRAKVLMHNVLGELDEEEWFTECRNSTGSSIGVPFTDTSLERKFSFPISITERAVPMFDRYMSFDYQLKDAVVNHNDAIPITGMYSIVRGSRAATVDKTNTIKRLICIEPTGNMFLQQGLMHMMYNRMKNVGLDVETLPERHKVMAFESSITSQYATIDWSSASDCVSLELLRWLLPPKWFYAVDLTRSACTTLDGTTIKLNMFSTMGNAVTFPLETLIFWTFAMAVLAEDRPTNSSLPNWEDAQRCSVFGDDCIVPTSIAPTYIDCMERVGFIINSDKSFLDSNGFRESCGGDFLRGFDVRPYNLRAPTSNRESALEPWLYIVLNSLLQKYKTYFGELTYIYDKVALEYIFSIFRDNQIQIKIVPDFFPDDSGAKLSADFSRISRCYKFTLSPIYENLHGTRRFNYCRYVYKSKSVTVDDLRYAVWLKKPYITAKSLGSVLESKILRLRRNGGYVVAKTETSFWSHDLKVLSIKNKTKLNAEKHRV